MLPGLILGLHPANERRCYFVTMSLIGWVQAYIYRISPEYCIIHYIPWNIHLVLFHSDLLWLFHRFLVVNVMYLPIFFRVASLALGQSFDCPSASEVTLKNMSKWPAPNHKKSPQNWKFVHISWDVMHITMVKTCSLYKYSLVMDKLASKCNFSVDKCALPQDSALSLQIKQLT